MQGEYEKWEYYRRTCSTLESDQEYVKFWETLLSTTQVCMIWSILHFLSYVILFWFALSCAVDWMVHNKDDLWGKNIPQKSLG
jgi:hypothetical protein